jgi:hypothetical protein
MLGASASYVDTKQMLAARCAGCKPLQTLLIQPTDHGRSQTMHVVRPLHTCAQSHSSVLPAQGEGATTLTRTGSMCLYTWP